MARGLALPKDLYYDHVSEYFRRVVTLADRPGGRAQLIDELQAQQLAGKINPLIDGSDSVDRHIEEARHVLAARVYVLDAAAVDLVVETGNRAPLRVTWPEPHTLPLWIEFDGGAIGDDNMQVIALQVERASVDATPFLVEELGYPTSVVRVKLLDARRGSKTFYGVPNYGMGLCWSYEQIGACAGVSYCQMARTTREYVPFTVNGLQYRQLHSTCQCFQAGLSSQRYLWALFNLLRAEGVKHSVVERRVEAPRDVPKHVRRTLQEQAEAWNTAHKPRYVRISLGERKHVRVTRPGADAVDGGVRKLQMDEAGSDYVETDPRSRAGHPRLLIPGPGKPWREELGVRLIWVRESKPFSRTVKRRGAGAIRYYATAETATNDGD